MCWPERCVLWCGVFKIGSVFPNKFLPFCSHDRFSRKLMHSKSSRECSIRAAHSITDASNAISTSLSLLFSLVRHAGLSFLAPKWRHRLLSRGILTTWFKYHFWGQSSPTLSGRKIGNFDPRGLKLRNYVFQRLNFITTWKKITLHRHFKSSNFTRFWSNENGNFCRLKQF